MERKQKDQLRILLEARKRADKVLAARRAVEQEKLDRQSMKAANQESIRQWTESYTAKAARSGILALAEQAAAERNGHLFTRMSCWIDYGMSTSRYRTAILSTKDGKLRPAHLAIMVVWDSAEGKKEIEIRIHRFGTVSFHNSILPVYPFIWKHFPAALQKMLANALAHPRKPDPNFLPPELR
ncbi:hypothetical protein EG834_15675 [bacterium]|nr:hypothetical protein [bacterium]